MPKSFKQRNILARLIIAYLAKHIFYSTTDVFDERAAGFSAIICWHLLKSAAATELKIKTPGMIKAIIIDDEMHCRKTLEMLLKDYCPDVAVEKQCGDAQTGLEAIKTLKPDVVFLDIEMPHMNGFKMLEQFSEIPFAVIFTAGYDRYAIRAIHLNALDYLLKPINPKELVSAIKKYRRKNTPQWPDNY